MDNGMAIVLFLLQFIKNRDNSKHLPHAVKLRPGPDEMSV